MTKQEIIDLIPLYREGLDSRAEEPWKKFFEEIVKYPDLEKELQLEVAQSLAESDVLNSIPVPSDLLERILENESTAKVVVFPRKAVVPVGIAAIFAIGLFLFSSNFNNPSSSQQVEVHSASPITVANIHDSIIQFEDQPFFEFRSSDLRQLKQFIAERGQSTNFAVPASLNGLPTTGCNVFDVNGHTVKMICFQQESGNRMHLFVIDKSAIKEAPPPASPRFQNLRDWPTASWSDEQHSYFLLSRERAPERGMQSLRSMLVSQ